MPRKSMNQKRLEKYQPIADKTQKLINTRPNDNILITKKGKLDKRQTFKTVTQKNATDNQRLQAQQCINAYKLDKLTRTNVQKLSETKSQKARKITYDFN